MKKREKRISKRKIALVVLFLLIVFCLGLLGYYFIRFTKTSEPKNTAKVISNINEFGYTLDDRDTNLMKDEFKKLRDILVENEIDYEKCAESLAKLFVIDFYTLKNKINKYDVGSLEYLDSTILDNFKLKAQDTVYKYIKDNSGDLRDQVLPEVSGIREVIRDENVYDIKKFEEDVLVYYIEWEYVEDLGYDNEAYVVMKKVNNKLVIVEFSPKENQD